MSSVFSRQPVFLDQLTVTHKYNVTLDNGYNFQKHFFIIHHDFILLK